MIKEIIKCEKHNLEYEATFIPILGIHSKCPECLKERQLRKEQEAREQEQRLKDERVKAHHDYLIKYSNIPKRYLNKNIDLSVGKTAEFAEHILNESNLIIFGDIGTGKTCFVSEILKANISKCGYYLSGNDLLSLKNSFKLQELLTALDGKGILVLDEFQSLLNAKEYFLIDLIIDKAYLNEARIIIVGNLTKEALKVFREPELKRVGSRLKDCECLKILDFGDIDLRS